MAWWNRLFKKKEPIQQEEDWEQLVYTRNGVNFDEEDQRKRYIVNCLEQIAEASKEIDLLTGEYTLVTSYLTDTDEIEALPAEQREEVNRVAGKLAGLEQESELHLALVYRGTAENASAFIEAQDALIEELYAEPEAEETAETTENTETEESEGADSAAESEAAAE